MQPLSVRGIVVRTVDYGEADRVVGLITEDHGLLSAFARGVRKSRKRYVGGLQPFQLVRLQLRSRRGSDLFGISECDLLWAPFRLLEDLHCIVAASVAADLSRSLIREEDPSPAPFRLLYRLLAALEARPDPTSATDILWTFHLQMLNVCGFAPVVTRCVRCGCAPDGTAWRLDASGGGAACPRCAPRNEGGPIVRADALQILAQSATTDIADGGCPFRGEAGGEAAAFLRAYAASVLGAPLPSWRLFLDLRAP